MLDCILLLPLITAQNDQFVHSSWFPHSLGCHWTVIIPVREQTGDDLKALETTASVAHGILLLCGLELDGLWFNLEFPRAIVMVAVIIAVNCTNY